MAGWHSASPRLVAAAVAGSYPGGQRSEVAVGSGLDLASRRLNLEINTVCTNWIQACLVQQRDEQMVFVFTILASTSIVAYKSTPLITYSNRQK